MRDWTIDRAIGFAIVVAALAVTAGACMPEVEQDDPPPDRVQPVFDSAAGTIPLPNDAALDDQGTLPDLEGVEQENAEGVFLRWLSSLHGWLPATPIEIPFNGRLKAGTVDNESVALYRKTDGSFEPVEIGQITYRKTTVEVAGDEGDIREIDGSVVTIVPANPLESQAEYAAVLTNQIQGAGGNTIVEPQSMFFAASEEPLIDEQGNATIETLGEQTTPEELQRLEGLRQSLKPVFNVAAEQGIERDNVAMAFRWSTVKDPMTVLDPATATLPLPNTAGLEDDGTFPAENALGDDNVPASYDDANNAQQYFNHYLDTLTGWPPTTPITLPIRGNVKADTITTENIQVWATSGSDGMPTRIELESVDYEAESGTVELIPANELSNQTDFVAFATKDVKNEQGHSLKLPAALQMAIQPHAILEDGSSTVSRISDDEAEQIDQLRDFLRPAATFVEENTDADPDELGAIWSWFTWQDTFAVFDPQAGSIPFPHDALRADDGTVDLPTEGLSGLQATLIEELNTRFGFSTVAPGWIPIDGPIDTSTLTDQTLQFMWINKGGTPEKIYDPGRYRTNFNSMWGQITVQTNFPWHRDPDPGGDDASTAGIVTTGLKGPNGAPIQPTPAFVFLRNPHPVFKNGESTVDQLDDSTAETLEESRKLFNQLLTVAPSILPELSVDNRNEVAMAWAWHPENTPRTVQEHRAMALATVDQPTASPADDPNLVDEPGTDYSPNDQQPAVDMSNVAKIQWNAEFETVDFLDDNGRLRDVMNADRRAVGISVFVPKKSGDCQRPADEGFDVAIVQHGLGGSRIGPAMALADDLAARCVATVTMDFPLHGGRTPGAGSLHPETTPQNSGMNFFSTDVVASKNHMIQSVVDLSVLAAVIETDGLEGTIDSDASTNWFTHGDDGEIGYAGLSLGGFAGVPFTTIEPNVETVALSAAGGKLARVLTEGALGDQLVQALEDAGLAEGTFARFRALGFLEWLADPVDPFSFTPWLTESPAYEPTEPLRQVAFEQGSGFSTGSPVPSNDVLMQMLQSDQGMDDPVVPNATTELLAEAAGVPLEETTFTGPHGLLFVTDPNSDAFDAAQCAQKQAASWLETGLTTDMDPSFPPDVTSTSCP